LTITSAATPIVPDPLPVIGSPTPRISSLLIKPVSALCNLDCSYCFYLDRASDPYQTLPSRRMSEETMERLIASYLFYSWPTSVFVFQGGEPTLAGTGFYERLCALQARHGRPGQTISNAMQTNGVLLDDHWCTLFREYGWLIGISIDGPERQHDAYRVDKRGAGTWRAAMKGFEVLQRNRVPFNILCVLSRANVDDPRGLYRFFRSLGVEHLQYIPLAEFGPDGTPHPFSITPEQYGRFLTETFDLWWPDRRRMRIRFFDNIAEALAGQKPSACTMHDSCDSYVVVEYNGDVYPCDFFVEGGWKLGNIHADSWPEIARRQSRLQFASKKSLLHTECAVCEYAAICHGGCPHLRRSPQRRFEDLDYFCAAYKQIFARAVSPIIREIAASRTGS
jgi:uncharacterized protein